MKNHTPKHILLGLIVASIVATTPIVALAQSASTDPTVPVPATPPGISRNISGKVTAKSDTSLTVSGRTVSFTSATTFSKGGASIGSGDVSVGDSVNIVTTDDGQVAVSVNILISP